VNPEQDPRSQPAESSDDQRKKLLQLVTDDEFLLLNFPIPPESDEPASPLDPSRIEAACLQGLDVLTPEEVKLVLNDLDSIQLLRRSRCQWAS
jgi:hypothetical protein